MWTDQAGYTFFQVVPYSLATLRIASSHIDMSWIEREMRSSFVIDVEERGVEPLCEMRDDERDVLSLSSDDDEESCPQSKRQRSEGSRYFADKMKIHRLNHKLSCMVRAKTDDLEQRRRFFKCRDYITFHCGECSHSYCGGSLPVWGACYCCVAAACLAQNHCE